MYGEFCAVVWGLGSLCGGECELFELAVTATSTEGTERRNGKQTNDGTALVSLWAARLLGRRSGVGKGSFWEAAFTDWIDGKSVVRFLPTTRHRWELDWTSFSLFSHENIGKVLLLRESFSISSLCFAFPSSYSLSGLGIIFRNFRNDFNNPS